MHLNWIRFLFLFEFLEAECQKKMQWRWKAERFPLAKRQIELVRDQLSNELFDPEEFEVRGAGKEDEKKSEGSSSEDELNESSGDEGIRKGRKSFEKKRYKKKEMMIIIIICKKDSVKSIFDFRWSDLTEKQKNKKLIDRLKLIAQKQSRKFKIATEETRTDIVCMRENPFYVQTVK